MAATTRSHLIPPICRHVFLAHFLHFDFTTLFYRDLFEDLVFIDLKMVPRFGGGKILAIPCIANQYLLALLEVFTQTLNNSVAVGNNANTVDTKFAFEAVNNRNQRLYIRFEVKNTKSSFLV